MATVNIVFAMVGGGSRSSVDYPAYAAKGLESENITSSGTSQQSTNEAKSDSYFVRIVSSGGNVRVEVNDNPTALATSVIVLDGVPLDLYVLRGDKVAVIDG